MPSVAGSALALGAGLAVVSYTGRSMFESSSDSPQLDRLAYKDEAKTRYRRPINETINELGEGRGMSCSKRLAVKLANGGIIRYLRTRIRRKTQATNQREIWYRDSRTILQE